MDGEEVGEATGENGEGIRRRRGRHQKKEGLRRHVESQRVSHVLNQLSCFTWRRGSDCKQKNKYSDCTVEIISRDWETAHRTNVNTILAHLVSTYVNTYNC